MKEAQERSMYWDLVYAIEEYLRQSDKSLEDLVDELECDLTEGL